jgi:hypothetical protein
MAVKDYETDKEAKNVEPLVIGRIKDTDWMQVARDGLGLKIQQWETLSCSRRTPCVKLLNFKLYRKLSVNYYSTEF